MYRLPLLQLILQLILFILSFFYFTTPCVDSARPPNAAHSAHLPHQLSSDSTLWFSYSFILSPLSLIYYLFIYSFVFICLFIYLIYLPPILIIPCADSARQPSAAHFHLILYLFTCYIIIYLFIYLFVCLLVYFYVCIYLVLYLFSSLFIYFFIIYLFVSLLFLSYLVQTLWGRPVRCTQPIHRTNFLPLDSLIIFFFFFHHFCEFICFLLISSIFLPYLV